MNVTEIGSCQCILDSIKTRVDGSVSISLNIDASNQQILTRLLQCFSSNEKLLQIAILKVSDD